MPDPATTSDTTSTVTTTQQPSQAWKETQGSPTEVTSPGKLGGTLGEEKLEPLERGNGSDQCLVSTEKHNPWNCTMHLNFPDQYLQKLREYLAQQGEEIEPFPTVMSQVKSFSQELLKDSIEGTLNLPSFQDTLAAVCTDAREKGEVRKEVRVDDWNRRKPFLSGTTKGGHELYLQTRCPEPTPPNYYPHSFDPTRYGLGIVPNPSRFSQELQQGLVFLGETWGKEEQKKVRPRNLESGSSRGEDFLKEYVGWCLKLPGVQAVASDLCQGPPDESKILEGLSAEKWDGDTALEIGKTAKGDGLYLRFYGVRAGEWNLENTRLGLEIAPSPDHAHTQPETRARSAQSGTPSIGPSVAAQDPDL